MSQPFLDASVKLYIADRSYPTNAYGDYKTLPYNEFPKVHDYQPMGSGGSGTVIHVESGYALVITCKHVISRPSQVTVTYHNRMSVKGEFLVADSVADLACVVIAADDRTPYVPIAKGRMTVGAVVEQAGYPGGVGPVQRKAKVFAYTSRYPYDMRVSFVSRPGDSGSGLYSPGNGLCGVVWGGDGREAVCVEQYDVERFYTTSCLSRFRDWLRGRPQAPPKTPGTPPIAPEAPSSPPITPKPPGITPEAPSAPESRPGVLDGIHRKIEDITKRLDGHTIDFAKARELLDKLQAAIPAIDAGLKEAGSSGLINADKVDRIRKDLEVVRGALGAVDGKLDGKILPIIELISNLKGKIDDPAAKAKVDGALAKVDGVISTVGAVNDKLGWLWPIVFSALGLGAVYPAVKAGSAIFRTTSKSAPAVDDKLSSALHGLSGVLSLLHGKLNPSPQMSVPWQAPTIVSPQQGVQLPPVVVQQGPIEETRYVEVPKENGYLSALQKMMDETASRHPGSADLIDALKSGAQQIYSGQRKK